MIKLKMLSLLFFALPLLASVVTQKVKEGQLSQKQNFNGTLSFNEKSRLASQSDGVVTHVYFDEGDYLKKGDILIQIDTQILNANIQSIQASIKELKYSLERAQLDFSRYKVLLEQHSVSKQKYDEFYFQKMQLEQKLVSLESTLKAQTIAKHKKSLRSPFSGYIARRSVQVGEWLKEGSEVALLINPEKIDILIHLPSSYIQTKAKNDLIDVTINDKTYKAKILGQLLEGDEKTRTFPLKLRLLETQDRFFNGMQARISLQKSHVQDVLLVSRDALIKRFGKDVVFIVKDKKAVMVPVQVIGYEGKDVAVSSNELHIGDNAITKGNERIFPNQEIKQ